MKDTTTDHSPVNPRERSRIRLASAISFLLSPFLRHFLPGIGKQVSTLLFHSSARIGDAALLTRWLKTGIDPDIRESMLQQTPLMAAAHTGDIPTLELLLEAGAEVNARNEHGGTALMYAAESGHNAAVALLLDAGAEIDAVESSVGHTALFRAAQSGHLHTVRLLIERGADPQLRMRANLTAAGWARKMAAMPDTSPKVRLACAEYLEGLSPA